jgi:hypothetical protein
MAMRSGGSGVKQRKAISSVSGIYFPPRLFSLKGAVTMNTANLTSPMNSEHLNDTVTGIDALALRRLDTAREAAMLGGIAGDSPPGL